MQNRPCLVDGIVYWPPGMQSLGNWRCREDWERTFLPATTLIGKTTRQITYAKRSYHRFYLRSIRIRNQQLNDMRLIALRQAAHLGDK